MMGAWMGSDFTNDDLVREYTFVDDYRFDYTDVADPKDGAVYIKAIPKEGRPIVWGSVVLEIDEQSLLPISQKYYDESGKLMRVMRYSEVKTFDGRRIPSVLELTPQKEQGQRTVLRYLQAQFDIDVPTDTFTQRNLRNFQG
jgi:hypothetical protein